MANLAEFNGESVTIKANQTIKHLEGGKLQVGRTPKFEGKVCVILSDGAWYWQPNEVWLNKYGKFLSELIE